MRVTSLDGKTWLHIDRGGDESYSSFVVSAYVNLGHGRFEGRNEDVQFLNLEAFVESLARFIQKGEMPLQLEGTYGTSVSLARSEKGEEIVLGFSIGDMFCGTRPACEFRLQGEFPLSLDQIDGLLHEFQAQVDMMC